MIPANPAVARAERLVRELEGAAPEAVELATRASLAVRVEPELLRALRLSLAPRLDVAAESDLWFSPLVRSRGPDGVVLFPEVSALLRERLRRRPEALRRAWKTTESLHRGISWALHLEERVAWLAASREDPRSAIDEALAPAVAAVIEQGRTGLARWASRALPRMPAAARATTSAWVLALAAARSTGHFPDLGVPPPQGLLEADLRFLLPQGPEVDLGIRREGEVLILGEEEGPALQVPDTDPRLVEVRWSGPAGEERRLVGLPAGTAVRFQVGRGPVRLRAASGAVYELAAEPEPRKPARQPGLAETGLPVIQVAGPWRHALDGPERRRLEEILPAILRSRRWFAGKARQVRLAAVDTVVPFGRGNRLANTDLALIRVEYFEGEPEIYATPLSLARGKEAERFLERLPQAVWARVVAAGGEGILVEALASPEFHVALLKELRRGQRLRRGNATIELTPSPLFEELAGPQPGPPVALAGEQASSLVRFGDRLVLKLFRRVEPGVHPEAEVGRFLTERAEFRHAPRFAGEIWLRQSRSETTCLGILQEFVPNEGDAWSYTLDGLRRYLERLLTRPGELRVVEAESPRHPLDLPDPEVLRAAAEWIGTYLPMVSLLGERTAELHIALSSDLSNRGFAPEPFSSLYRRSFYQSVRTTVSRSLALLRSRLGRLPPALWKEAEEVLGREEALLARLRSLVDTETGGVRIRCHGDCHLGQVLFTGKDFVFLDFEGDPGRPLSERRLKRPAFRDVASMLRSFDYAAYAAVAEHDGGGGSSPGLGRAAEAWVRWVSSAFLENYLSRAAGSPFVPDRRETVRLLLDTCLLEKACHELRYEMDNRPDWAGVPLRAILRLAGEGEA